MKSTTSLMILAFLLCALGSPVAFAQTLKIATIAPEGSSWMKDMKRGAEVIEAQTQGRVKFKFYGGGVQGNDKQVQRKMRTGQLQGGAFTSGAMNMFQRDADLFSMPMVFNSIEEVRYVRKNMDSTIRERLEEAGYVNFGFAGAGFAYMMSNKPLQTLAELKGQKVWIPEGDPTGFAALRALGVAPVVMPVTDVMTGLQTDLLDSVTVPPVGAVVFQWHTRLKYITELPIAYVYGAMLADKKAFSRLSAEDQSIAREVMEGIYRKFDQNGVTDNENALQALLESGLQMVLPDTANVSDWRNIVSDSNRKLAMEGTFDPALLDRMQRLIRDYQGGAVANTP
jgi:TRAP-type C4-dicarboxylate transport system substrate-binding protein